MFVVVLINHIGATIGRNDLRLPHPFRSPFAFVSWEAKFFMNIVSDSDSRFSNLYAPCLQAQWWWEYSGVQRDGNTLAPI